MKPKTVKLITHKKYNLTWWEVTYDNGETIQYKNAVDLPFEVLKKLIQVNFNGMRDRLSDNQKLWWSRWD